MENPKPATDRDTWTDTPCPKCNGVRLYFDKVVRVGSQGSLRLCPCVSERCQCGGRPPYQYWTEESLRCMVSVQACPPAIDRGQSNLQSAQIPERFRWKFQDDFQPLAPDGASVPFASSAQSYVSTLVDSGEEPRRGFLLHGSPGTGKTLLGCIMLNELMLHRARSGRFVNLSRSYFNKLRDTYSEASQQYGQTWQIFEEMCSVPYLLLDDFGVQRDTAWEQEMLYDLVDGRYGGERFTIVTTNQPLGDLRDLFKGRIYSRLVEMCHVVEMNGVDFRLHLQPQRGQELP